MEHIVDRYFWKSTEQDIERCIILKEKEFGKDTFANPLGLLKRTIRDARYGDDTSCIVCKWHPFRSFSSVSDGIEIRFVRTPSGFDYMIGNPDNGYGTAEDQPESTIFLLFETIIDVYRKRVVSVKTGDEVVYHCPLQTFSYMNPHVRRIAALRIKHGWVDRTRRMREKQMKYKKQAMLEILMIPKGGYDGKRRHIRGGILYLEAAAKYPSNIIK